MSIASIASGGSAFASSGIASSNEGRLALMMLEHEDSQQQADRIEKGMARSQYVAATNDEVEALEDEASHTRLGAVVGAAAGVASAGIQLGDACSEPCDTEGAGEEKPWGEIAAGLSGTGGGFTTKLFDSAATEDRAEGKRAQQSAQLAEWDLSEAKDAIEQSQRRQDKATDWLSANSSNAASTMSAIIAGLA